MAFPFICKMNSLILHLVLSMMGTLYCSQYENILSGRKRSSHWVALATTLCWFIYTYTHIQFHLLLLSILAIVPGVVFLPVRMIHSLSVLITETKMFLLWLLLLPFLLMLLVCKFRGY